MFQTKNDQYAKTDSGHTTAWEKFRELKDVFPLQVPTFLEGLHETAPAAPASRAGSYYERVLAMQRASPPPPASPPTTRGGGSGGGEDGSPPRFATRQEQQLPRGSTSSGGGSSSHVAAAAAALSGRGAPPLGDGKPWWLHVCFALALAAAATLVRFADKKTVGKRLQTETVAFLSFFPRAVFLCFAPTSSSSSYMSCVLFVLFLELFLFFSFLAARLDDRGAARAHRPDALDRRQHPTDGPAAATWQRRRQRRQQRGGGDGGGWRGAGARADRCDAAALLLHAGTRSFHAFVSRIRFTHIYAHVAYLRSFLFLELVTTITSSINPRIGLGLLMQMVEDFWAAGATVLTILILCGTCTPPCLL